MKNQQQKPINRREAIKMLAMGAAGVVASVLLGGVSPSTELKAASDGFGPSGYTSRGYCSNYQSSYSSYSSSSYFSSYSSYSRY